MDDPVVLSFHDSILRESDVALLDGPYWLNDRIIGFFFEYLDKFVSKNVGSNATFIAAEVSHLIKMSSPDEVAGFVSSLELHKFDFVFLPVNDADCQDTPGGTHWSLLLYSRSRNVFFHYDSWQSYNFDHANRLMANLIQVLACPEEPVLMEPGCPQQDNEYDCGVHVIFNAFVVVEKLLCKRPTSYFNTMESEHLRKELKDLILSEGAVCADLFANRP